MVFCEFCYISDKSIVMAIFKVKESRTGSLAIVSSVLYLAAAVLYFTPADIPYKICFPLFILTIFSAWLCPWQISLALFLSAAGDLSGSLGSMPAQMGFFAAAHVMFIWFFAIRYFRKVEPDFRLTGKAKGFLAMVLVCVAFMLYAAFTRIIPGAPAGVLRIGTGIYACIISLMLVAAMLQRSSLYALGAVMFVFSDFILAWNMFTEAIPHAGLLIMVPYYTGQWLLYIRSTSFRVAPEMRLMRF